MSINHKHRRNNQLAKIHIAKKDLGLSDDDYRAVLWARCRVRSASQLDHAGRQHLLDHFKALGWRPKPPSKRLHKQRLMNMAGAGKVEQLKKIEAQLLDAERPVEYADAIAFRMFKIKKVIWCSADQLHKIITALNKDAAKHDRLFSDAEQERFANKQHLEAMRAGQQLEDH